MTLGAVLIVKNEAQTIARCIVSARAAGVETFTVVDTGSTDGTPDLIREACEGVDLRFSTAEFVNFGRARSLAFERARGSADWLLALDSDFTVAWGPDFIPDPMVDAYDLEMTDNGDAWRLPLLLRGELPWISRGSVHEYTLLADGTIGRRVSTDAVRITNHGTGRGSPEKSRWHLSLLEAEMAAEPANPRPVFYAAQTARDLGDVPKARALYARRVLMGGWEEERWYAQYRLALLEDWPERLSALLTAWEVRWHRLEPLYDALRELNSRDMHAAAYRLSAVPVEPSPDTLFLRPWVWDWGITFERSIASWWLGERAEFERLTVGLLANPRLPATIRAQVEANAGQRAA